MRTKFFKTFWDFTANLKTTGAFYETSKAAGSEVCSKLNGNVRTVVEFGSGHGNITRKILESTGDDVRVLSFEVNPEFCDIVRSSIHDKRLKVINDSASNFQRYVTGPVDAIISSIPITLIPKETVMAIIGNGYAALRRGGYFSQILYSRHHLPKFRKVFDQCSYKRLPSLPPEFIYHCRKN